ncbi:hypothetical protein EST38_g8688 [Candolleomyces aberdarensis]|uniref:DUF7923 domain-containing protein n=1 Tax=Candolleomyces aberdarensis TaxID=2316362 RepID=A0A4Q2DFB3_9AGAR|nr:hypothetical protein EST38_g8688 [Candolleomyces aberdarensis]
MSLEPSSISDVNEPDDLSDLAISADTNRTVEFSTSGGETIDRGKRYEGWSNPPGVKRIVILIDGDGAVFDLNLIAKGIIGGREAGLKLVAGVTKYLHGQQGRQLRAFVFLNKHGLTQTLRATNLEAAAMLGDFMIGFSQASQRFMMIDVGALIEGEICLPRTEKIIFAGTHDGGYKTIFRSHITSGYKDKLVLLKTYDEDAARFAELGLDIFPIENLFDPEKLERLSTATPRVPLGKISNSQTPPGSPSLSAGGRQNGHSFDLLRYMHTPDERPQEDDLGAELENLTNFPNDPDFNAAN